MRVTALRQLHASPLRSLRSTASRRAGNNPNEGLPAGWHSLRTDPAVERWAWMRENVYTTFKFTPKNTLQLFIYVGIVPYLTYRAIEWSHLETSNAPAQGGSPAFRSRPPGSRPKREEKQEAAEESDE